MPRRKLVYMPVGDLAAAPRNDKGHAAAAIRASIGRFGFLDPIVLDDRTGAILSGHGRVEQLNAAEAAGEVAPRGITVRKGRWHAPVLRGWESADDEHALGAGISVNRVGEVGGWDNAELHGVLDTWAGRGEDLAALGYEQPDLDDLRAWLEEDDDDDEPAPPPPGAALRAIMLDYPIETFEALAKAMRRIRAARGYDDNAALVRDLVVAADRDSQ